MPGVLPREKISKKSLPATSSHAFAHRIMMEKTFFHLTYIFFRSGPFIPFGLHHETQISIRHLHVKLWGAGVS